MNQKGVKNELADVIDLPGPALSNQELVRGLIRRETYAARQFHQRFGARIDRLVWRLLGADTEHHDLVHQVYVNILSSIRSLRKIESLSDWVNSVTFRTVRKELRNRKVRRLMVPSTDHVDAAEDNANPQKAVYIRRFYAVLAQLEVEDRMIFVLRYLEGHSLEEVAAAGQYSLSTAKRRIKRAKEEFESRVITDPILVSVLKSFSHVH